MHRFIMLIMSLTLFIIVSCDDDSTKPGNPPDPPVLLSPQNGSSAVSISPTLSWTASDDANNYSLQVSTDNTFTSNITINQTNLQNTSYLVNNLEYSIDYFWRVNAVNNYGTSEWTSPFSFTTIPAPSVIIWEDGFETYSSDTWPSSWNADGNSTNIDYNYVDGTIYSSGSKSLKLFGTLGGCWGAIAYRPITITAPFEIEVKIRNGNETLSGCHPDRAYVGLRQGTSWANPARGLILFDRSGAIRSNGSVTGTVLEASYSTLTWYTVRILYERPSSDQVKISYWINGVSKGSETFTAIAEENLLVNLDLETQEGTVWFDDVKIIQ